MPNDLMTDDQDVHILSMVPVTSCLNGNMWNQVQTTRAMIGYNQTGFQTQINNLIYLTKKLSLRTTSLRELL